MLKIVLFPAPLGPKSPTISPEFNLKLMLSRICLLEKDKETFSNLVTFYPVKMRAVPSLTYVGLQVFDASTSTGITSTRSFYGGTQTANLQLFHAALIRGRGVYCSLTGSSSYAAFDSEL